MAYQEICNFEWGLKQFEQKVCSPGCTGYSSWDQQIEQLSIYLPEFRLTCNHARNYYVKSNL